MKYSRDRLISTAFLIFALPAFIRVGVASALPTVLDLQGYLGELDRWGDALTQAKASPALAAGLRGQLPDQWLVDIEGERYTVPTAWIRSELETIEKSPRSAASCEAIYKRLQVLRDEALRLSEVPASSPAAARAKLNEILKRREFRGVHGPTWLDTVRERVVEWLYDVLQKFFGVRGVSMATRRMVVWLLIALSGLLLTMWMVRWWLRRQAPIKLVLEQGHVAAKRWQDRAREALAAAERGDFRDATRLAYWAGVYRLEELGFWKTDRTRTHREYLRLLPASHPQRDVFADITRRFELAWYARLESSGTEFEAIMRNLERLGCVFHWKPATARS